MAIPLFKSVTESELLNTGDSGREQQRRDIVVAVLIGSILLHVSIHWEINSRKWYIT